MPGVVSEMIKINSLLQTVNAIDITPYLAARPSAIHCTLFTCTTLQKGPKDRQLIHENQEPGTLQTTSGVFPLHPHTIGAICIACTLGHLSFV